MKSARRLFECAWRNVSVPYAADPCSHKTKTPVSELTGVSFLRSSTNTKIEAGFLPALPDMARPERFELPTTKFVAGVLSTVPRHELRVQTASFENSLI
jgi:hypothetical protein